LRNRLLMKFGGWAKSRDQSSILAGKAKAQNPKKQASRKEDKVAVGEKRGKAKGPKPREEGPQRAA